MGGGVFLEKKTNPLADWLVTESGSAPRLFARWGQNFLFVSFTACSPEFTGGNDIALPPQPHLSGGKLPPLPDGGAAHELNNVVELSIFA